MAYQSIQYGATQTAYVSYANYDLGTANTNLILYWPNPYLSDTSTNVLAATTNFTCTQTGCSINLPNANEVSLGMNVFITNVSGTESFSINDYLGNQILSALEGDTVYWLQLISYNDNDQSTTNGGGTWTIIQQGAGTSSADAATLKGYGLTSSQPNGKLTTYITTTSLSDSYYTIQTNDESSLLINTSSGVYQIDLSSNVSDFYKGFNISINNSGSGSIEFIAPDSVTINNGSASAFTISSGQTLTLVYDGTNWWTLGLGQSTAFVSTVLTLNISALSLTDNTYTLTQSEESNYVHQFYSSSDLTSDIIIYYPTTTASWYVSNYCTYNGGSLSIQMIGSDSDPIPLSSNARQIVYSASYPNGSPLQLFITPTLSEVTFPDGTLSAPSITFTNDETTGFYLANETTHELGMVSNAEQMISFTPTLITIGNATIVGSDTTDIISPTINLGKTSTGTTSVLSQTITLGDNNTTTVNVGTGTAATTINIGTAAANTVNIGTGASSNCTLGVNSGTTTINGNSISIASANNASISGLSGYTSIGNNTSACFIGNVLYTGIISLRGGTINLSNTSSTASIVNMGTGSGNNTLNIGTGSGVNAITIGNSIAGTTITFGSAAQQSALNSIMPSSPVQGEIVWYNGTNWVALAAPTAAGQVLTSSGSGPYSIAWETPSP